MTTTEQVQAFKAACERYGFTYEVRGDSVVTIARRIHGREEFCDADMMAGSVLELAPLRGGSVWGTDGGSIGGASALATGNFRMHKSGTGGKRFMRALAAS